MGTSSTLRVLGAVLLSLAVSCTTLGPSHRGAAQSATAQAYKTVKVAQEIPDASSHSCGSAVLIRATPTDDGKFTGLYLTAKHVVDLTTKTTVLYYYRPNASKKYYAKVRQENIKHHPFFDAATFKVTGLPGFLAKPVPIASEAPNRGDWILSAGYANCDRLAIHSGFIIDLVLLKRFGPCLLSNAKTVGGMSGGPVLNIKGEVVGITVAKGKPNQHFSVSVHALADWLKGQ
jgi:S1-C subfamily serine protease